MHDVIIVGAGPAGSTLALRLARMGYDAVLLDRSRFPRPKACGDYLCSGGVDALHELGVAERVLAGAHPIRRIALHGFGEHVRFDLPGDGARSLARDVLDARLLEAARAAGAQLVHGSFMQAQDGPRQMRVLFRDATGSEASLGARLLVGADGAWSAVAHRCGLARKSDRRGRWAVGGELNESSESEELEMYVARDGYYARNPLGSAAVNSMLVLPRPAPLSRADAFVTSLTCGALRFEAKKMKRVVAVGPLAYRAANVMRDRVLLTGDAAELLDPFTGQGVATALKLSAPSARATASLLAGVTPDRVAREYRSAWDAIVSPRRRLGALVRAIIRLGWLRKHALRGLRTDAELAHTLLAAVSDLVPARRALAPKVLWKLLVA
ncbi:MAG TPA: NAD(P)/FAD-dependent oxidoreductase [Candidatus Acidoferrales bacterium]|nr:NAD(P)/FAD-dependent oxidoreductase [Candidatus Acidoferrales bacterium]